jgi:endo-alpha-1,4-polygalactosaminidase (GH114 family)
MEGRLIVRGCPKELSFAAMAAHALRSAQQFRKAEIVVEKVDGSTRSFMVRDLERKLLGTAIPDAWIEMGTVGQHKVFGNTFEKRKELWAGEDSNSWPVSRKGDSHGR